MTNYNRRKALEKKDEADRKRQEELKKKQEQEKKTAKFMNNLIRQKYRGK